MNRKRKIFDQVIEIFGILYTKESPWYLDRLEKFNEILGQDESPAPVDAQPNGDEVVKAAEDYAFQVPFNGTNEFYDIKKLEAFKAGAASRQPEVDALKKELEEYTKELWKKDEQNAALKKRVEELEGKNKALLEFMQSQYSIKGAYEKSIYEAIIKDKHNPQ